MTSAARAALGPQVPVPTPARLAYVVVEDAPKMRAVPDPLTGEPIGQYAEVDPALGLTDQMADRFRAICDYVDGNSCEANGCISNEGGASPAGIGWVLAGDADERTEWRGLALIQRTPEPGKPRDDVHVIAVCLDCSPENVYDALWKSE